MNTFRKAAIGFLGLICLVAALEARAGDAHSPAIAGPWQELFQPSKAGVYINDHCLYQDPEGEWHLVGITGTRSLFGQTEKWFAHGVTPDLSRAMVEQEPLFVGYPDDGLKWAPHALWEGSTLHLFAGPGPIRHFVSNDGYDFEFVGMAIEGRWRWLRDTMVLRRGKGYIMYATDRLDKKDVVSAFTSDDLYHWEDAGVVFIARRPAIVWAPFPNSACESPFVIEREGGYYMSVTLTNYPLKRADWVYLNTLMFYSEDPLNFGVYAGGGEGETARLVARFEAHAPEYVEDGNGGWWITACGWAGYPRPAGCEGGKACIAPLEWR